MDTNGVKMGYSGIWVKMIRGLGMDTNGSGRDIRETGMDINGSGMDASGMGLDTMDVGWTIQYCDYCRRVALRYRYSSVCPQHSKFCWTSIEVNH